jgi:hypothetical protein
MLTAVDIYNQYCKFLINVSFSVDDPTDMTSVLLYTKAKLVTKGLYLVSETCRLMNLLLARVIMPEIFSDDDFLVLLDTLVAPLVRGDCTDTWVITYSFLRAEQESSLKKKGRPRLRIKNCGKY